MPDTLEYKLHLSRLKFKSSFEIFNNLTVLDPAGQIEEKPSLTPPGLWTSQPAPLESDTVKAIYKTNAEHEFKVEQMSFTHTHTDKYTHRSRDWYH